MQYLIANLKYIWKQLWPILNPNQELSWRTFLFLCLFSWLVALAASNEPWILANVLGNVGNSGSVSDASALFFQMSLARWLLFTAGWVCLCLSVAWLLVKAKIVIPFFDIKIYPAAWVVGLLTAIYFFILGNGDVRTAAIVGWPIISAGYTLLPKVVTSTGKFNAPDTKTRQQFTILFLASATVSCWFQFQVLVQRWVTDYPVLLLGTLEESAFVIPVGARPPVFDIAEATLDQTLQLQSIPQVRNWVRNAQQFSEPINDRFQSKLAASKTHLLDDLLEEVTGNPSSVSPDEQATIPTDVSLNPEQWRMIISPDLDDSQGLGIWMELQSRPVEDSVTLRQNTSIIYPCIVERYTPSTSRLNLPSAVRRGLDNGGDGADANALTPSENVEDYIQSRVQCADRPEIKVTRAS
ncbi:MAG: DUF5357 family protein [Cyanobacteria bacterium P01_F01_bin.150]